jgi:hypothetical protein
MDRIPLEIRKRIQWIRTVPMTKRGIEESMYRVPRVLSDSGKSLYEMVLERGEMSPAEAKWIADEHSLLFRSIWRYWVYADSRLLILDSMRYSSPLSIMVFICFIVPIWIWNYFKRCDLFRVVGKVFKSRKLWKK